MSDFEVIASYKMLEGIPTLRDQFAMAALQGILAGKGYLEADFNPSHVEKSYEYADAMLKARQGQNEPD